METLGAMVVFVAIATLMVLLVRRMRTTKRVTVAEDIRLGGPAREVEAALVAALASVEGATYLPVAPGLHAVTLERTPPWAIIPVCLLFPVGLVFLLVRQTVRMDAALFDTAGGAVVRLSGRTESFVLERVRGAIASVPVG